MKKTSKFIYLSIFLTIGLSSPILKSLVFPGWGELSEYSALHKENDIENINYIKERARYIMFQETALWLGFNIFKTLSNFLLSIWKLINGDKFFKISSILTPPI